MTVGPPNIYAREGKKLNIPGIIISNALEQANRVQEHGVVPILTLNHLSHLTKVHYSYLRQIVERKRDPYHVFQIRKRAGGKRIICIPDQPLLLVQRWIHKNILSQVSPHNRSFAYSDGSSITKCASEHCGNRWLIKIDIRRFFESITEKSVYRIFHNLGYNELISFELARICTRYAVPSKVDALKKWEQDPSIYSAIPSYKRRYLGHIPQGSPTSPMIANLVSVPIDYKIQKLSEKNNLVYTRYADDLIFSTINDEFNRKKAAIIVRKVYNILELYGFEANTAKTVIVPPGARKIVLGLLVDREKPNLTKQFKNQLRTHIRGISRFGFVNHARHRGFKSIWGFYRHFKGLLSFAYSVDSDFASPLFHQFEAEIKKSGFKE